MCGIATGFGSVFGTLLAGALFGGALGLPAAIACATSYLCSGPVGIYRAQRPEADAPS